jgi:hypothetical protein
VGTPTDMNVTIAEQQTNSLPMQSLLRCYKQDKIGVSQLVSKLVKRFSCCALLL